MQQAARVKGVQLHVLKTSTKDQIDAAFASLLSRKRVRLSSRRIRSSQTGVSSSSVDIAPSHPGNL